MDDYNSEFEKLYHAAFENTPYAEGTPTDEYVESLDEQRQELVDIFHTSLTTIEQRKLEATHPELYNEAVFALREKGYSNKFIEKVTELFHESFGNNELLDALRRGEFIAEGLFPVMTYSEKYWSEAEVIRDGFSLRGEVYGQYVVGKMTSYARFMDIEEGNFDYDTDALYEKSSQKDADPTHDVLGVWCIMNDATIRHPDGSEETHEVVLVPITFPTLRFSKVHRIEATKNAEGYETDTINLDYHFKGDVFQELASKIENDLNYNGNEGEVLFLDRAEHQVELEKYMSVIDQYQTLLVSATDAVNMTGSKASLDSVSALYTQTTTIYINSSWRVAHAFIAQDDKGEFQNLVHILPEDLIGIYRQG